MRSWAGHIGHERRAGAGAVSEPLFYAEGKHAILSAMFPNKEIPNEVGDWLLGRRLNLADYSILHDKGLRMEADIPVDISADQWEVSWMCPVYRLRYRVRGFKADAGIIYRSSRGEGADWEELGELEYIEKPKGWRIWNEERALPRKVAGWLCGTSHMKRLHTSPLGKEIVGQWAERQLEAPWVQAPTFVLDALLPAGLVPHLALLQSNLRHKFRNMQLLAQAMTHPSNQATPALNYQRLALIGSAAVELLVSEASWHSAPAGELAWTLPEAAGVCGVLGTGGDSCPVHLRVGKDSRERQRAICNHLMYKRTAVDLGLDRAVQHASSHFLTPHELGDLFLACVGAIIMDGEGLSTVVRDLVEAHIERCQPGDRVANTTADMAGEQPMPPAPGVCLGASGRLGLATHI